MNKNQFFYCIIIILLLNGCIHLVHKERVVNDSLEETNSIGANIIGSYFEDEVVSLYGKEYSVDDNPRQIGINYDFDRDGKKELLIGFQGISKDSTKTSLSFLIAYGEGHKILQIFNGNDRFVDVELVDIDSDSIKEIIFHSAGGAHYSSIDIYKYHKGSFKLIFSNGSSCGFETQEDPFVIKIYREEFDNPKWCYAMETNRYEIWKWDGKKLSYNKALSTSKLITEEEAQEESYHKLFMKE